MSALSTDQLDQLREGFRGTIITPDDNTYESTRTIWNGMFDKRPAVIAQCIGTRM